MKTKEERNARNEEVKNRNETCAELSDDALSPVNGAGEFAMSGGTIRNNPANASSDDKTTGSGADSPSGYQISERMRVHER